MGSFRNDYSFYSVSIVRSARRSKTVADDVHILNPS